MNKNNLGPALALGVTLAVGLIWSGSYLKDAVTLWKQADRLVSVKGLAEREVEADLVLWPISFSVSADSLEHLYQAVDADKNKISTFLTQAGFTVSELSFAAPVVQDLWANQYGDGRPPLRYKADAVLLVRTQQVDRVKKTQPESAKLVSQGILLTQSYEHKVQYIFTQLNDIKPQMIADATANARQAAAQFADDAGAKVGSIRSAQQGYFSVSDLDSYTPETKKVRVVTNVEYSLE
ncbi:MAG: SIMPL domain-containing protein [Oceanisphaera sp.]